MTYMARPMQRSYDMHIFIAAILAVLVLGTGAAHADTYLSLGVGSEAVLGGELENEFHTDQVSTGRIAVGHRQAGFAVEAVGFGTGLRMSEDSLSESSARSISIGVDVKYHIGILAGLEGYGRAGLHKSWLSSDDESFTGGDFDGSGHIFGLGLDYVFPVPVVAATVWLDYSHQTMTLQDAFARTMNGTVDMITVGMSIGI